MFKKLTEQEQIRLERGNTLALNNRRIEENQQQGIEISEREINEIMLGRQISDIEIQLLELQGGM